MKLVAKKIITVFSILVVLLLVISCTKENKLKIGIILPLSGSAAYYGDNTQKGIELAKEKLLKEYPDADLKIYYEDSFYTAKGGVDAYNKLRNINGINAVITAASQVSLAVLPLTTSDKVVQMAVFSSNEKYSIPDDLSFRVSTKNDLEMSELAKFMIEREFKKLGILYLNNEYGVGVKESFKNKLLDSSVKVIIEESYMLEENDFRTNLLKIKESEVDTIFIVGTVNHYVNILKQANEIGLNAQFLATRSAEDPNLIKNAGGNAEGLVYPYPFDATSTLTETRNFVESFKSKYGVEPDAYAAEGYEGFILLVSSLLECDENRECIKNYFGDEVHKSVFGDLKFDQYGDPYYEFHIKTIRGGNFVFW